MARLKVFDNNAIIKVANGTAILDPEDVKAVISIITKIELLSWPTLSEQDRAVLGEMIATMDVIDINPKVEETTIALRRTRHLKLPDAVIAATALSLNASLVTNDQAFQKIDGLLIESI